MGFIAWSALGIILTTVLGVGGASRRFLATVLGVGGASRRFLATALGTGDPIDELFDLSTWLAAIAGSLIIRLLWKAIRERRIA